MLKATVITPAQAEHYYRQENYYSKEESVKNSQWYGKGAEKLGLSGNVGGEDFSNLLYGNLPNKEKFRTRPPTHAKYKERAGIDLTFSAPKSVSLAVLVNGDRNLEQAHKEAVKTALSIAEERYAQTRIRENGNRKTVTTGNLVIAQFHHDTSREKDPQLHTHAVVINGTQNSQGRWYSLNSDELFRQQKLLGTIYQNELAIRASILGYEIEQRGNGQFELKGYAQEHLDQFSKRRKQIKEAVGEGASRKQIELAALKTRKPKGKEIPREELQKYWQTEGKAIGIRHPQVNKAYQKKAAENPDRVIAEAIEHSSERTVNFKREDLEKFVLSEIGAYSWSNINKSISNNQNLIVAKEQQYTTMAALNRELDTIRIVNNSNDSVAAIATSEEIKQAQLPDELTKGQREAVAMAANTKNRYIAWQGKAGVGKTYALKKFKQIAEERGYSIKGYAPSASAAKVLGDELKIESNTVARKLVSKPPKKDKSQQQIWIVDEAGLLNAKDTHSLLQKAEEEKARILFVGDTRQLSAVEAGNPFKSLQKAGIQTAYLNQSLRQKTADLKAAVDKISEGEISEGVKLLDENGRVKEAKDEKRAERIADDYLKLSPEERRKTLILAGTHADREDILNEIRTRLKQEGSLSRQDFQGTRLKSKDLTRTQMKYAHHYEAGDTVMPLRNYGQLEKGKLYSVTGINEDILTLESNDKSIQVNPSQFAEKAVYEQKRIGISEGDRLKWTKNDTKLGRRNGQEFTVTKLQNDIATIKYDNSSKTEDVNLKLPQNFDHALVSTTYSSQGKTANRVIVSATSDKTLSKESFYVAASRAKYNLKIYAQDKDKLLTKVQQSRSQKNPLDVLEENHNKIINRVEKNLRGIFTDHLEKQKAISLKRSIEQKNSNKSNKLDKQITYEPQSRGIKF